MSTILDSLKVVCSFLIMAPFWACTNQDPMLEIKLVNQQELHTVPSASGIEFVDGQLYAIGDNAPWLFHLNSDYSIANKWPISSLDHLEGDIIEKKEKPDFEAMTTVIAHGKKTLLIFGSGSKLKKRSSLVWAEMADSVSINTYSLEKFYKHIIKQAKWNKDDLNIEAAVTDKEYLYLLNRANNNMISVRQSDFVSYILSNGPMPVPTFYPIELPKLEGIEAGFSGATINPDSTQIIFTASVENTSNWIDDGQILGSFVGLIKVDGLTEKKYTPVYAAITKDTEILKVKIESVAFKGLTSDGAMQLLMVTDSDGGVSEILEITLANLD